MSAVKSARPSPSQKSLEFASDDRAVKEANVKEANGKPASNGHPHDDETEDGVPDMPGDDLDAFRDETDAME